MLNNEPPEILGFFQDSYLRCDTRWGCYRLTNHFPDLLTRFPIIFYFKTRSNSDDSVFYFRDHSRSFYFLHHSPMFLATKFRGAARDIPSPPIVSGISLRALSLRDCMNKTFPCTYTPGIQIGKVWNFIWWASKSIFWYQIPKLSSFRKHSGIPESSRDNFSENLRIWRLQGCSSQTTVKIRSFWSFQDD